MSCQLKRLVLGAADVVRGELGLILGNRLVSVDDGELSGVLDLVVRNSKSGDEK